MIQAIGKKLALLLMIFILLAVPALLYGLLGTESGTRWLLRQVLSTGNLDASVETIEGTFLNQLTLKKIRFSTPTERMMLDSFSLNWEPSALLTGALHIRSITGTAIVVEPLAVSEAPPDETAFSVPEIPLDIFIDTIDLQQLRYKTTAAETLVDRIQLTATLQNQSAHLTRLELQMPEFTAQGQGEVQLVSRLPMTARLNWELRFPDTPEITGETAFQGDLEALVITGTVGGAGEFTHQATIRLAEKNPSINFSGNWKTLHWPLSGPVQVSSQEGRFTLSGTLDSYRIELDAKLAAKQLPPFTLTLSGQGDAESLNISELKLAPKQGLLISKGRVSWTNGIGFDLAISARQFNPGDFIHKVPGSLNLQADASGQVIDGRFSGNLNIERLDGTLQGYPVNARGKLALNEDQLQVDNWFVQSGKNQLTADGRLNPQRAQLQFTIDAPDLASVWPGLAGSIKGQGSVQGDYQNPVIVTELTAEHLRFQAYAIRYLKLAIDYAEVRPRPSTLAFQGRGLSLAGQSVERLSVEVSGSIGKHQLKAHIDSAEAKVDVGMIGAFKNKRWDGAIDRLILDHQQLHRWQLAGLWPVSIEQQSDLVTIDLPTGCLIQGGGSVCLSMNGAVNGQLEARTEIRGIDLALLEPWLPEGLALTGPLTAEAEAFKKGDALTARMQIQIPETVAKVTGPDKAPLSIPLSGTHLNARYQDDRLTADARIGLGGADFFSAQIKTGSLRDHQPLPLSGAIQASITDMSFFDALVPEVDNLKGRINADLLISGNSELPVISGSFGLNEARMSVPLAGIAIKNINLQVSSNQQQPERLVLTGHADSGKGSLDLNGTLDLNEKQGFPVRIQAMGSNFEIAKLPQAEIAVSPQLLIQQRHDHTELSGDVTIDKATLEITEIPENATAPSEDEVIVGEHEKATDRVNAPTVLADVNIVLGDQVHFSGYGLTTRLKGKLRYTSNAKQQRMQGRVAMSDAKYKAYGQDLTLTKGEFLFNGPADNPWLNIEATRKASGEDVTAILRVTGPLKSPETKVSTTPPLPESEALAYLLTGRSLQRVGESQSSMLAKAAFSYGAGQLSWLSDQMGIDEFQVEEADQLKDSSVRLGKYINPDFYIGLSLGFFSNNYAVLFKQQLSKHFSLQTRAGESQRIDLKYQLDTD